MPFKDKEKEKECKRAWYLKNREHLLAYRRDYYQKNKEKIKAYARDYRLKNPEKIKALSQKYKLKAMQIVSKSDKPKCIYCDCDDLRILEINHKNLDGYKEMKVSKKGHKYRHDSARSLYLDIIAKRRTTQDLEITCKICNAKHYVEEKFGLKFSVTFLGDNHDLYL